MAQLALDGLPAWRLVVSRDRAELLLLQAIAERAEELVAKRQENQGRYIINSLAELLEGR